MQILAREVASQAATELHDTLMVSAVAIVQQESHCQKRQAIRVSPLIQRCHVVEPVQPPPWLSCQRPHP